MQEFMRKLLSTILALIQTQPQLHHALPRPRPQRASSRTYDVLSDLPRGSKRSFDSDCLDQRQQLASMMKGKGVHVDDLSPIFEHWPLAINPEMERIRIEVNEWLKTVFPTGNKAKKLSKADFGLFAAVWWPKAEYRRLRALVLFSAWVFFYDDEIEIGDYVDDFDAAQRYRTAAKQFAKHSLDLCEPNCRCTVPDNKVISCFEDFGRDMRELYDREGRQRFLDQINFFVDGQAAEQMVKLQPELPALKDFIEMRMGTSGAGTCLALVEFAMDIKLPQHVFDDKDFQFLWDETNILTWLLNDIISLPKELKDDGVDSTIPLILAAQGDLQSSFDTAVMGLRDSVKAFDEVSRRLQARYAYKPEIAEPLSQFIETMQFNCTGTLFWSLRSGRYGFGVEDMKDGMVMQL